MKYHVCLEPKSVNLIVEAENEKEAERKAMDAYILEFSDINISEHNDSR